MPKTYKIIPPLIPSGYEYYFTTESGIKYEVRFGQKRHNILKYSMAFGVLNEEFEGEEYVSTNRGEIYNVMATIGEIVQRFLNHHPNAISIEFTGESKEGEDKDKPNIRTRLYLRYINRFMEDEWKIQQEGNKVIVYREQ
jgi:hypothetical protein